MKASALTKESIKETRVFAVEGEDAYWLRKTVSFFASLVPEDDRAFNLKFLDALHSIDDIASAVTTFSMFSDSPVVVVVRDAVYKEKANEKGRLMSMVSAVPEGAYLLLLCPQLLTPALKKKIAVIDAGKSDLFEVRALVLGMFPPRGIEPQAVDKLIAYTARDMARIELEIAKLTAYADGKTVTAADVEALVADTVENEIFEFTGALAARNTKRAAEILAKFTERGVSQPYLLAALIGQYRRMLHAKMSTLSEDALAEKLGVKPFAVRKARETAAGYTTVRLKACLDALTGAEYNFKSGVMSEDTAFRSAVAKLMSGDRR